ncbi:MAG: PLP-dependent aminotransferase family protein [Bacilli bacterium]|nr:PLP-dependent aminotransferase family protein [Bacilli bacterium]
MEYLFADRTQRFSSSAVRDILAVIQQGDVISFAGGLPGEDFFPTQQLQIAYEKVFASGKSTLQYGVTEGYWPLRELLSERMKTKNIKCTPDAVLMTTGSQQAIDLFSRVMLSRGDIVLTDNPTYLAALQVFRSYEAEVYSVQSDALGMDPADLEMKIMRYHPKFIYVVPNFSNPDGKLWSLERRELLLELAQKYDVLILEDDPYGEIRFDPSAACPSLASLDQARSHVLYTSTFSKTVVPALRSGWITGPSPVMRMIAQAKQASDLHSSSLDQRALYFLLRDFNLDTHIRMLQTEYKKRMTMMRDFLIRLPGLRFVEPQGGMFIWVKAMDELDMTLLLTEAISHGVAYVPGAPFFVENPQNNTFRLNFTHSSPEILQLGMSRLASVITA